MNQDILTIAPFFSHHKIIAAAPFGNGNINDTFLITDTHQQFILQRLNSTVFAAPHLIFENQLLLQKLLEQQVSGNKHIQIPQLILTLSGHSYHKDDQNHYWRAQEFIKNSHETKQLLDHQAESVGHLLGTFHRLGQNQSSLNFHDTLPDLHATTIHIRRFNTLKQSSEQGAPEELLAFCNDCIDCHQQQALHIDQQLHQPDLPKRLIHGDPKLANILFNKATGKACSLIDLDTIGPGIIHHDLSDLIRSCCNLAGEESRHQEIYFELGLAKKIITGYSRETAPFLSQTEINLLGKALWIIPFELGVRFLNDYLSGSTYFKTSSPHQNLSRARTQLQLAMQIHQSKAELQEHINSCFA